jgi:hypothetical protein
MPTLRTLEKRRAERVVAVRNLLEQHAQMKEAGRMNLSELEWVLFRLGCSIAEGEKLIAEVRGHETVKDAAGAGYERWTCRSCDGATCLRAPHMSDAEWSRKLQAWQAKHPPKKEAHA